jgi:hypothetical protein
VQAAGVVGYVVVEFALVITLFAFLTARPEATESATKNSRTGSPTMRGSSWRSRRCSLAETW